MRTNRSMVRSLIRFGVDSRFMEFSISLNFLGGDGFSPTGRGVGDWRLRGRDMRLLSWSSSLFGMVLLLILLLTHFFDTGFALSPLRGCSRLSRFEISISRC